MSQNKTINVYTCERCGWKACTVDRVEGTTPFMIRCEADSCGGTCVSACYNVDQKLTPTHEWYRPDLPEIAQKPWAADHVRMGGLLVRKIGSVIRH